jgi:hypothetical protein
MNVLRLRRDDLGHGGVVIPALIRRLRRTANVNAFHTALDSTLRVQLIVQIRCTS